jgi:hypothetical protein
MGTVAPGLPRAWQAMVCPKDYAAVSGPNVPVALGRR